MEAKIPRKNTRIRALFDRLVEGYENGVTVTYSEAKDAYDNHPPAYAPMRAGYMHNSRRWSGMNVSRALKKYADRISRGVYKLKRNFHTDKPYIDIHPRPGLTAICTCGDHKWSGFENAVMAKSWPDGYPACRDNLKHFLDGRMCEKPVEVEPLPPFDNAFITKLAKNVVEDSVWNEKFNKAHDAKIDIERPVQVPNPFAHMAAKVVPDKAIKILKTRKMKDLCGTCGEVYGSHYGFGEEDADCPRKSAEGFLSREEEKTRTRFWTPVPIVEDSVWNQKFNDAYDVRLLKARNEDLEKQVKTLQEMHESQRKTISGYQAENSVKRSTYEQLKQENMTLVAKLRDMVKEASEGIDQARTMLEDLMGGSISNAKDRYLDLEAHLCGIQEYALDNEDEYT